MLFSRDLRRIPEALPYACHPPDFAGFETGSLANTGLCIVGGHYTAPLFNSVKRGAVV